MLSDLTRRPCVLLGSIGFGPLMAAIGCLLLIPESAFLPLVLDFEVYSIFESFFEMKKIIFFSFSGLPALMSC